MIAVRDVYAAVLLERPDIETARFFVYLNDALDELRRRYDDASREELRRAASMEDELPLDRYYVSALVSYICAKDADNADLYGKYMAEYMQQAENAYNKRWRARKNRRVYAPKAFR